MNGLMLAMLCQPNEHPFLIRGLHPSTTPEQMTTPSSYENRHSGRYDLVENVSSLFLHRRYYREITQ